MSAFRPYDNLLVHGIITKNYWKKTTNPSIQAIHDSKKPPLWKKITS